MRGPRVWLASAVCSAVLIVMIVARPQAAQPTTVDYPLLVQEYRSGDADRAVQQVAVIREPALGDGLRKFLARAPSRELMTAAAAMHAEVAFRASSSLSEPVADRHRIIATGFAELGAPARTKLLGAAAVKSAIALSPGFRRVYFLAAITTLHYHARTSVADDYLTNARRFFPHDAEMLLLSGVAEEMRGSGRLTATDDNLRRDSLRRAELYLRESLDLAPERMETRLRLGRVLSQRGLFDEARPLLAAVASASDSRLDYLAALFLGGLEDATGNISASLKWYEQASAAAPVAQSSRLAASELHHRAGARQDATTTAAAAVGSADADDPWWPYLFGEYWRVEPYLDQLREMARQ